MQVTVTGKHTSIEESFRQYAEGKAYKMERYYDRIQTIEVFADKSGNHHAYEVEMLARVDRHEPFVARAQGDDLYSCVDVVHDKLERQLTDYKEKQRNRKHPASS